MIKLLKFCKQYNLDFKLLQEDAINSTLLYFTRRDNKHRCSIVLTNDELNNIAMGNDWFDGYIVNHVIASLNLNKKNTNVVIPESFIKSYRECYAEYKQLTIEQMLQRADVVWFDNVMNNTRQVISHNDKEPLTEKEQDILINMWRDQGIYYEIEFKVLRRDE